MVQQRYLYLLSRLEFVCLPYLACLNGANEVCGFLLNCVMIEFYPGTFRTLLAEAVRRSVPQKVLFIFTWAYGEQLYNSVCQ